jgi:hypothetical protein
MTRDHLLGWHNAAQLIADSMPAPVKPCPVRLVPVFEFDRTGIPDVDPVKAASLKNRAKEVEQAAFEIWLARVRPGGDVESVQQQWEDSSDYADLMEDLEEPGQAPAAALGDGWIAWYGGECPVEPGTAIEVRLREPDHCSASSGYDFAHPTKCAFWRQDGLGNDIVAYRLIPTEAA